MTCVLQIPIFFVRGIEPPHIGTICLLQCQNQRSLLTGLKVLGTIISLGEKNRLRLRISSTF